MSQTDYIPVAVDEEAAKTSQIIPIELSPQEVLLAKKATRTVISLCFFQIVLAVLTFFKGGFILMCVSAFFITIGLSGAARQSPRHLIAHFVYSLALYMYSCFGTILMIVYCYGCPWWTYVIGICSILVQLIGMRQSRILICLLKKKEGTSSRMWTFKGAECKSTQQTQTLDGQIELQTIEINPTEASAPSMPNIQSFPLYPIPAHQMVIQPQPRMMPQFYPMQPSVQYPMMQQPVSVVNPVNLQQNSQGQPIGIYPVVYGQI